MSNAYNSMIGFLCGQLAQGKCPTNRELIERYRVPIIREQIAAGTYESEHKLDVAADELLDDINREGEEAERFENSY